MKRRIVWRISLLLCAFSVFSCKGLKHPDLSFMVMESASAPQKSEIFTLLGYFRYLDSLSKEALDEEYDRIQKLFSKEHTLVNRLKLAILLSRPNIHYQDYNRSLDLLTKYSEDPAKEDRLLRELSFFLSYFIQRVNNEKERYQDLTQKFNEIEGRNTDLQAQRKKDLEQHQKLKDQNSHLKKETRKLKQENRQQAKERKKLQKMIDGLKSIEKNLMKRDQAISNESGDRSDE